MLLTGKLDLSVEVHGSPVPPLRGGAGQDGSGPELVAYPRQQNTELGRYAGTRLLLQSLRPSWHRPEQLNCGRFSRLRANRDKEPIDLWRKKR